MGWEQILGALVMVVALFFFTRRFRSANHSDKQTKIILDHFTRRFTPLRYENEKENERVSITLDQVLTDDFLAAFTLYSSLEQFHIHSPVSLKRMDEINAEELEQLNLFVRDSSRFYEWVDLLRSGLRHPPAGQHAEQ